MCDSDDLIKDVLWFKYNIHQIVRISSGCYQPLWTTVQTFPPHLLLLVWWKTQTTTIDIHNTYVRYTPKKNTLAMSFVHYSLLNLSIITYCIFDKIFPSLLKALHVFIYVKPYSSIQVLYFSYLNLLLVSALVYYVSIF